MFQNLVSPKDVEFEIAKMRSKYEYLKKEHPQQARRIAIEMRDEEGPRFLKFALDGLPKPEWKKKKTVKNHCKN